MAHVAATARVLRVRVLAGNPPVCRVDLEGGSSLRLDAATVSAHGLSPGAHLDDARLARLHRAAVHHEARVLALRLLQRRLRGRVELERALRRRGIPRDVIIAISAKLRRSGWIDDTRFTRAYIRDRLALRPSGARRLRAELVARGVGRQVVEDAVTDLVSPEVEGETALAQATARMARLRGLSPDLGRRRLAAWLLRRGYAPGIVAHVVRHLYSTRLDRVHVDSPA